MTEHSPLPHKHRHHAPSLHGLGSILRKNAVLCIATLAAILSCCVVPPDAAYRDYFDWKTLTCLFCVLAVVCALKNIRFFTILARKIVECTGSLRRAVLALVYITFIGSMLIANDMALLTFLPLGYFILSSTGSERHMAFVFILQNIAANLGGMLTPFGNPQNLYLYTRFAIPTGEFMGIMLFPFLLAILLITLCCFLLPKSKITVQADTRRLPVGRTVLYLLLFALSIIIVFRFLPYWWGLLIIPSVLFFADKKALRAVDYPLLLTFFCFFVFAGNMARIPEIRALFSAVLEKNTLLVSTLSCQVISNVPSAILLSNFTDNYRALLLGVNIGGTGTLIASLASLITFREYTLHNPGKAGSYLGRFTLMNVAFLLPLFALCAFLV